MKREDLFLAIGEVESTRLARSELAARTSSDAAHGEETNMKQTKISAGRIIRNILVAALIVSMVSITAYAAVGYLIFGSPEQMLRAVLGDRTGYDHSDVITVMDPEKPGSSWEAPAYDRVEADPTVVERAAKNVTPVGKRIQWHGYTLTVEAYLYDSATGCGLLTYLLENPDGVPKYEVNYDGSFYFPYGTEDIQFHVRFSQYGYDYLIPEKCSDTTLAATYYFRYDPRHDEDGGLKVELTEFHPIPQGEAEKAAGMSTEEYEKWEQIYFPVSEESITIPVEQMDTALECVTAGQGDILVSPISMRIDIADMGDFLTVVRDGEPYFDAENLNYIAIRYKDGTEYIVEDEKQQVSNRIFCQVSYDDSVPAEDIDSDMMHTICRLMFNRIIDVSKVEAVILNDREFPIEK